MPSRKVVDKVSVIPRTESTASSASSSATANDLGREEDSSNSIEGHNDALSVTGSNSPEDLRQQAMEEKRRYRTLKAEGKAEEALKVFKHAKELERQAGALEIAIRKNRKIAAKVSNSSSSVSIDRIDEQGVSSKKKSIPLRDKEEKDDLFSELRELGWSDVDIHDAGRKPADLSLEGEFANLLGETFQKSEISKKKGGIDKSPVLALKRKALLLKREGRLAEAKEELKQAKLLEKQLEEQELLGEASGSEDELSAIINSMDDANQDNLNLDYHLDGGSNFEDLLGATDDPSFDENFEITDNDMNDPVLVAALQSFGWTEEDELVQQPESVPLSQEALQTEVLNLKKEALSQKRAGNVSEAMALLKKAKLLEQKLDRVQSVAHMCPTELNQSSAQQIVPPKSKMVIQKELLALKKESTCFEKGRSDRGCRRGTEKG
ncbi:hypothetical protein HPP92_016843 [Vanilla planifolia]|uniref:Uncharacterized protein n=1 Tax=Vanilla planifolia TaxID=51239 RepID=A0A835QEU7_VANPL|nr:hypothetical protein HPP92_016843 [Vanilla planifolia]